MSEPIKLAVVGAGAIGKLHIEHIVAEPEARLHAIVDPTPEAKTLADENAAAWYPDLPAMLVADRPDGVIIATPNHLHVRHGLQAVEAGIPALIEKPLADSLTDAARLVERSKQLKIPLLTGHHRRHNPMIRRAKTIIESGQLGRLVTVHGFFLVKKPDNYFDAAWRREPGAGPVLLNLIHDIDLMRHLCGEIETVQAFQSNMVRNFPVDETTVICLKFANGALGTMNISDTVVAPWSWEQTTGENPAYPHTDQSCYFIAGTEASLSLPRLEIWSNVEKKSWLEPFKVERTIAAAENPLRLQIRQFCRVIRGREVPLVSGEEGLKTLKVVDAIKRAAASSQAAMVNAT